MCILVSATGLKVKKMDKWSERKNMEYIDLDNWRRKNTLNFSIGRDRKLIMTFEGFQFVLKMVDQSDDAE